MTIRFFDDIDGDNNELQNWSNSGGASFDVNEETLSANKSILEADPTIQVLNPDGTPRSVSVPASPTANPYFIIINDSDGLSANGNTLTLDEGGPTIVTLDDTTGLTNIRAIYTGTKWVWF